MGNEASLFLRNSSVDGNTSTGDGGGISNINRLLIEDTRVSNNACAGLAGGIYNNGDTTVRRSLIDGNTAGNDGGGYTDRNGTTSFVNVSMVGNHAGQTGDAYSCGFFGDTCTTQFSHCTISDNTADAGAGGLAQLNGFVDLTNTLVARNGAEDVAGGFTSNDYNLIQNVGSATGFVGFHDQLGVLPLDGAPGANGANGADGLPGDDGYPSASRFTDIPFGDERCPMSGRLVEVGADRNGNSALDPDEVQTQSLLCMPDGAFLAEDATCSLSGAPRQRSGLSWAACLTLLGVVLLRRRQPSTSARLS